MKCPNCNNEVTINSQYCKYCGIKIDKSTIIDVEQTKFKTEEDLKTEQNIIDKRIYTWKEKLIDLSKRNRLLNFKTTKYSTLRIIDEQPPEIYRLLVQKLQTMKFLPININEGEISEEEKKSIEELNSGIEFKAQEFKKYRIGTLEKKHTDQYLQTKLSEEDLNRTLGKISTTARLTNDDLGYNVLFLSLGSIIWYEDDNSDEAMEAPVLLVPIEITRKNIGQAYTVKYNEDSIILNPALTLKLKRDFGIILEDIIINEDELDPIDIFTQVQDKIKDKFRWKLLNNIYIGLFSFAKFVMYKDLDEHSDIIKRSKLVNIICGTVDEKQATTEQICPVNDIDERNHPKQIFQILDADSSQQQAIQVVKSGNNLVIEGPPGTGKSQTIANIIAELLSQNKKVLFVSQKIAALEVVKKRLDANGLSPYCLELHSNKTNKKRVLSELVNTLEYSYVGNYINGNLSKLSDDITKLKEYSKELHEPIGDLKYSPFKALGIILKNKQIPDFRYFFYNYEHWSQEILIKNKAIFTNAKEVIKKLGNPKNFSWYGCETRQLEFEDKIHLQDNINLFLSHLQQLVSSIEDISNIFALKPINTISQIKELLEIADIILNIPYSAIPTISDDNEVFLNNIKLICNNISKFNLYSNKVKGKYNLDVLKEDIDTLISKFTIYRDKFLSRISLKFYKDYKFVKKYFDNSYKPKLDEIVGDLKNLKELQLAISDLENCDSIATKLYDQDWAKNEPNIEKINIKSDYLIKFKKLVDSKKYFTRDILAEFYSNGIDYTKIKNLVSNITINKFKIIELFKNIQNILKFDCDKSFLKPFEYVSFSDLINKFKLITKESEDLTLWFKYLKATDDIKNADLSIFWDMCEKSNMLLDDYDTALETNFLRTWLNGYAFKNNEALKQFSSLDQDKLVEEFKSLDKYQIDSAKIRLLTKLSDNACISKERYYREATELKRQGKLQKLRKSLRQIIRSIPNLFLSLKPCLMMSPSTVAQLLDPNIFHFDVVIFDEASQLTTEDCIGSIIRGDKLVVAGDTKQLPPTSFFKTIAEAEDEDIDEEDSSEYNRTDLDSILDECTTSRFPQCMLKWHYRSKHEHLIAFSNEYLYKDLYTFPSCTEDSENLGVKFMYHQPIDTTKENKRLEEAQIVARAVMKHAKKYPNMSLGVATLNIKQKGLIETEIENLRKEDQSCEDFFDNTKSEYFFVKNLESIQGDERDVIMISVGYFKNQNGILPMNFGPINKAGGERRLNVLITRARYMVEVFSGIKASDFDMGKTSSTGVQLLQYYLDFAEHGKSALKNEITTNFTDSFDSPFEETVCKALREHGYYVKTQVGCSKYKIDLAIIDKHNPGQYLLGIECDGASYHSRATVRDRDRLRQEVLENLGWKIYRIWSTDWFKNPKKQLDKLVYYIDNLTTEKNISSYENK